MKPAMNVKNLDGNVFSVLGRAVSVLKSEGLHDQARLLQADVLTSKSYDLALARIAQDVEFVWGEPTKAVEVDDDAMPAGKYVIADPCYIVNDETYGMLLEETFDKGRGEFHGHPIHIIHTAHGDGSYEGNDGKTFLVDSGTIACIALSGQAHFQPGWEKYPQYEFTHTFGCEITDKGVIKFGDKVEIETDGHWCEECHGRAEYCECDQCGECNQYCNCSEESDDDDDDDE